MQEALNHKKGVRKVKQFISQPLVSKTEITERQNLVQFLVESAEVRNNLSQSILQKIPDIGKINIRISQMQQSENIGARVALAELARVNLACKKIPAILELLRLGFSEFLKLSPFFVEKITKIF